MNSIVFHGIYLPIAAFALACLVVFVARLGIPLLTHRRADLRDNYLAVSVIGFVFVLGYETPLYWIARNIPELAWAAGLPVVYFPPKFVAAVALVFAAAGLSRALTKRARLSTFAAVALALWALGAFGSYLSTIAS